VPRAGRHPRRSTPGALQTRETETRSGSFHWSHADLPAALARGAGATCLKLGAGSRSAGRKTRDLRSFPPATRSGDGSEYSAAAWPSPCFQAHEREPTISATRRPRVDPAPDSSPACPSPSAYGSGWPSRSLSLTYCSGLMRVLRGRD
jgi:hypothetical protein